MKTSYQRYTLAHAEMLLQRGFSITVDCSGVVYTAPLDEMLVSSQGMGFTILLLNDLPEIALRIMRNQIKYSRDAVWIEKGKMETCPKCGQTESAVGFYLDGGRDPFHLICNGCGNDWKSDNYHDPDYWRYKRND